MAQPDCARSRCGAWRAKAQPHFSTSEARRRRWNSGYPGRFGHGAQGPDGAKLLQNIGITQQNRLNPHRFVLGLMGLDALPGGLQLILRKPPAGHLHLDLPGQLGVMRIRSRPPRFSTKNSGEAAGTATIPRVGNSTGSKPLPGEEMRPEPAAANR